VANLKRKEVHKIQCPSENFPLTILSTLAVKTVKTRHLHLHITAISKMSVSRKKREKRMGLSWAQCNAERYNMVESLTR
jgi:hypothetical protein